MRNWRYYLQTLAFLSVSIWSYGHGGEDHGNENKKTATESKHYFTVDASSTLYEIVLRYGSIQTNEDTHIKLFLSDFQTNKPIDKAQLKITSPEDESLIFKVVQLEKGIYEIHTRFKSKTTHSLSVAINSELGPDLISIQNVQIGKVLNDTLGEKSNNSSIFNQSWFLILIGFVSALVVVYIFSKLSNRRSKATFLLILFVLDSTPIPTTLLRAHGGENHEEKSVNTIQSNFSNLFEVPKETQFLFDVWTKKLSLDDFTESTELFGTVIPSSKGQVILSSPQNGRISSLHVQVGQRVKKGQKIAVIEQNIEASSQVNLLSERNAINAEFEAAKKEFERLSSIADIASKRDLSESEARFNRAKANKQLFNSNSGRNIVLKSPIDGVIGNFNFSKGSTVNSNENLFTITNLSKVFVEAQVFDRDGEKIKTGVKYTVQCTNDNHKTAEVKLIALAQNINATNQSQRVLFEMENPNESFKIGEFVTINAYASNTTKQTAVPKSAITQINGKSVVFVKDNAEQYKLVYVLIGEENGTYSVINKGVSEGERIVVNGSYALKMMYLNQ